MGKLPIRRPTAKNRSSPQSMNSPNYIPNDFDDIPDNALSDAERVLYISYPVREEDAAVARLENNDGVIGDAGNVLAANDILDGGNVGAGLEEGNVAVEGGNVAPDLEEVNVAADLEEGNVVADLDEENVAAEENREVKVIKRWKNEWGDTWPWAFVEVTDDRERIFCRICQRYGRQENRNVYGTLGSTSIRSISLRNHAASAQHIEAVQREQVEKGKQIVDDENEARNDEGNDDGRNAEPTDEEEVAEPVIPERTGLFNRIDTNRPQNRRDELIAKLPFIKETGGDAYIEYIEQLFNSLNVIAANNEEYADLLKIMLEPERTIIFRVPWVDDDGRKHVNKGFRVLFNGAIGPHRGGLRFHPSLNLSTVKFLGFLHTLKNALSPHRLGGSSGGSDFDPKGKSDNEILRFCQSFMNGLFRHLGPDKDLPSEEMGVGTREMGYLFGQYRVLAGHSQGIVNWSGSGLRVAATAYGLVSLAKLLIADCGKEIHGLRCVISGFGKIAMNVLEELIASGGLPVTLSDSKGYLLDEEGFSYSKLSILKAIKARKGNLSEYTQTFPRSNYIEGKKPWGVDCFVAFPCASEMEIDISDAETFEASCCQIIVEGSNMPCTNAGLSHLFQNDVMVAPSIVAGIGGVIAGEHELEDGNTSLEALKPIIEKAMKQAYEGALEAANKYPFGMQNAQNLMHGAVISAFMKVAKSMIKQGYA